MAHGVKKKLKVVANLKGGISGMEMPCCDITEGGFQSTCLL